MSAPRERLGCEVKAKPHRIGFAPRKAVNRQLVFYDFGQAQVRRSTDLTSPAWSRILLERNSSRKPG